ncbi:type VI secretion system membrane subunit TssM [Marinobacterium arenosum]|uniref:type VI secretion system membrane subunit TssM n=1 Tax=Marinobacterium arenosum TaxID=2862496 RepID=UPI001C964739|nr:type VI secretion system membrane subunit TssM [Marinobacterium arenosum]MBY4677072.1 type VI secretion system membrane subunit TssM [Marinobacterium arenosum]
MESPKLAVWPFILLALLLGGLCWGAAWLLEWWHWNTPAVAAISGLLSLLSGVLLGWLGWFLRRRQLLNRPSEAEVAEKQQRQFRQRLLLANFEKAWRHQSRGGRGPYDTPWYFLVDEQLEADRVLLQQMGFEQIVSESIGDDQTMPVSFWISDHAVLVALHTGFGPDVFTPCLAALLKRLKSQRPRQAANGVMLALPVAKLLESGHDLLEQTAKRQRLLLQQLNQSLGLDLPIYSLFTGMGRLKDFCQYFATFDDQRLEEPLGAMMPVAAKPGYDTGWFLDSFDRMLANLAAQVTPALKAQLSAEYRDSILAGPYQFGLLRAELEDYFRQLFLDNQFEERPLNFRGYFFTNADAQAMPVDRLTMLLASRLGLSGLPAESETTVGRSLFAKQLLRRGILPEAALVGVNRRREGLYNGLRIAYTGGLSLLFLLFLWLLKANFDYYQRLDRQAVVQLDSYKQKLLASKPNPDDLTASIFGLSDLRDISRIYDQSTPWYVLSWLPDPGIGRAVEGAYQQELEGVLLIALRDYLVKDLYVFNKLDDKVHSLELYNLHQMLYDPQRDQLEPLVDYYVESLQQEGEGDVATLERFRLLIRDLLKPGVVPPPEDDPLIELVRASLSSEDLGDLLYQHILQQPAFSRRVDMRSQLGQNYRQVYAFSDGFGGYLVPYIFTREGFQELMTGTGFELAREALKDYEGVVGRISNETELSRVNRKLKRRYIEDYIGYWQRLASNVHWQPTSDWGDTRQQLEVAAEPLFSPVKRFYNLVSYHTDLAAALNETTGGEEAAKKKAPKVKGKLGGVAKKAQGPLEEQRAKEQQRKLEEQRQSALKMADAIAQPFVPYHRLIQLDDAGRSNLDVALRQISQTLEWVKQATISKARGRFFLDQLVAAESVSPLAQMQTLAQSYRDELLRDLLQGSAEQLNQLALNDVRQLLNKHWSRDVLGYYSSQIKPFYPFEHQARLDVGLKAFKEFFGPQGLAASFSDSFLSYFNVQENSDPVLNSFLPGRYLALDERFWNAMEELSRIRKTFFTADNVGLQFSLRAQGMSAGMTEFSLRSEGPLYVYRNGPALWSQMSWPIPDSQSRQIEMKLKGGDHVVAHQTYPGIWSWFRLAEALNGALTPGSSTSYLVAGSEEQVARLQIRVEGDTNPFVAGFFANLDLPEQL